MIIVMREEVINKKDIIYFLIIDFEEGILTLTDSGTNAKKMNVGRIM